MIFTVGGVRMALTKKEVKKIESKIEKMADRVITLAAQLEKVELLVEAVSVDLLNLSDEIWDIEEIEEEDDVSSRYIELWEHVLKMAGMSNSSEEIYDEEDDDWFEITIEHTPGGREIWGIEDEEDYDYAYDNYEDELD